MTALPQNMQALERANKVRLARASLKQDIFDGVIEAADVIADPPEHAGTMTVFAVLDAQNRWGEKRVRKLLRVAQVYESKTLGSLTERQRRVLVDLLNWGVVRPLTGAGSEG